MFFFFSFLTLTATLIIIAYYVVKTLLDEALQERPESENPSRHEDQISELANVNVRQEERQALVGNSSPQRQESQATDNYNPYNPFNESKMNA